MKRRTKQDMQWMKTDVSEYLFRCDNNPHKAWDLYIKENLAGNKLRAHYIKGIKDFINVSKELEEEIRLEQEEKQRKAEKKRNREEDIIKLKLILSDEGKAKNIIYPVYKEQTDEKKRLDLVGLLGHDANSIKYITDSELETYRKVGII